MFLSPFICQKFRKNCIFDNGIKYVVEGYVWKPNDLSVFFCICIYYYFFVYHFRKRTPTPHFPVLFPKLDYPLFGPLQKHTILSGPLLKLAPSNFLVDTQSFPSPLSSPLLRPCIFCNITIQI